MLDNPTLKSIAGKLKATVAQVCLAWALRKQVAVDTKTENESRMKENFGALKLVEKLSDEDAHAIDLLNLNIRKFWNPYTVA